MSEEANNVIDKLRTYIEKYGMPIDEPMNVEWALKMADKAKMKGRAEARDEIRQIIHNIYTQDLYCKADLCEKDEKGYDCEDCLFNAINQTLEGMKETKDE